MEKKESFRKKLLEVLNNPKEVEKICEIYEEWIRIETKSTKESQKKGIEKARKKGVTFGRPRIREPENFDMIYEQFLSHKISAADGAKLCNMAMSTFYRRGREWEEKRGQRDEKVE